jgi:hypothetical protein
MQMKALLPKQLLLLSSQGRFLSLSKCKLHFGRYKQAATSLAAAET